MIKIYALIAFEACCTGKPSTGTAKHCQGRLRSSNMPGETRLIGPSSLFREPNSSCLAIYQNFVLKRDESVIKQQKKNYETGFMRCSNLMEFARSEALSDYGEISDSREFYISPVSDILMARLGTGF